MANRLADIKSLVSFLGCLWRLISGVPWSNVGHPKHLDSWNIVTKKWWFCKGNMMIFSLLPPETCVFCKQLKVQHVNLFLGTQTVAFSFGLYSWRCLLITPPFNRRAVTYLVSSWELSISSKETDVCCCFCCAERTGEPTTLSGPLTVQFLRVRCAFVSPKCRGEKKHVVLQNWVDDKFLKP